MEIEKAIKLLQALGDGVSLPDMQEYQDVCKLGAEALKWRLRCTRGVYPDTFTPLPGETED